MGLFDLIPFDFNVKIHDQTLLCVTRVSLSLCMRAVYNIILYVL